MGGRDDAARGGGDGRVCGRGDRLVTVCGPQQLRGRLSRGHRRRSGEGAKVSHEPAGMERRLRPGDGRRCFLPERSRGRLADLGGHRPETTVSHGVFQRGRDGLPICGRRANPLPGHRPRRLQEPNWTDEAHRTHRALVTNGRMLVLRHRLRAASVFRTAHLGAGYASPRRAARIWFAWSWACSE